MTFDFIEQVSKPPRDDEYWRDHAQKLGVDPTELLNFRISVENGEVVEHSVSKAARCFQRILASMGCSDLKINGSLLSTLNSTFRGSSGISVESFKKVFRERDSCRLRNTFPALEAITRSNETIEVHGTFKPKAD